MTTQLAVRGVQVRHGAMHILRGIDLDVAPGEICALMGLSGSGKTTLLRTVAALQPLSDGAIAVGDVSLRPGPVPPESRLRALRRQVGMVFQAHALFEHLSALDNVTLAPVHVLGWPPPAARCCSPRTTTTSCATSRPASSSWRTATRWRRATRARS